MNSAMPVEQIKHNLDSLLQGMRSGETVTVLGSEGEPLAVFVSLNPSTPPQAQSEDDWEAEWDELARRISQAWKSEKGAVETLLEMRR